MRCIVVLAVAAVVLAACGTLYTRESGTRALTRENVERIKDGATTKDEIRAIFGNPLSVTTNQFGETWTYSRASEGTNAMGLTSSMEAHALVVTFGKNGVVSTHSYSVTQPVGGVGQ